MQHWQLPFLGLQAFPTELTAFEIGYFFTFTGTVRAAIFSRYGDHHRLAGAIQIGFIKMTGRPLDAFDTLPVAVLRHLGTELEIVTPESTSLRVLYGRRSTLYEHQAWAAELLGFRPFTERRQRTLAIQVRREAHKAVTIHRLVEFAKRWLYERRILIPGDRRLRELARTAYGATEQTLLEAIRRHIPAQVLESWREALFQPRPGYTSTLEWLQQAPRSKLGGLKEQLEKVAFLKALHVDAYALEDLRLERQRDYARHMRRRRPARFRALKDPRLTLEMVCFLRITLLQTTDVALSLADLLIQELRARAVKEVRDAESRVARTFKPTLREIRRVLHDPAMTDTALRRAILALMPSEHDLFPSRAAAVQWKLNEKAPQVRPLLKALLALPFEGEEGSSLTLALSQLRDLYAHERRSLPRDVDIGFAPRWAVLVESPDRQRALRALEAATLFALRKALRNGSAWIGHSLAFRRRHEILIPDTEWTAHHRRYYEQLGLPMHASGCTPQLLANLEAGLASLAEAVEAEAVLVDDKGIHLKALEAEETPPLLETTKSELFKAVGVTQLPDLIMAINNETRFSWRLLGRPPLTEAELLLVYAALLAHGTELNAASVALMIPGVTDKAIADAMRLLEDEDPLREANELVVQFLHRHEVVKMWGEGTLASSDTMSLEASRYLWNARVDPRRRTYAMGIYSHVLDQWGIIYDQPLVLHQRQAGAAIEGVVRQTAAANVERLAVDTHGYTDFGMAIGKLLGLDLCPRLSHLRDRRLHVPRGWSVRAVLAPVVEPDVSLPQVEAGWDQLIRVAASIEGGWTSAVLALTRFGAASRADPIHKAGSAVGKLLRTLFLCDFMSNEVFRREVLRILNHGESVHTLQRAIDCLGQTMAALEGPRRYQRFGQANLPAVQSRAYLAWCHAELGTFAAGRTLGDEGLQIAEAVAHPGSLVWASYGIGVLALRQGDLPRALPPLERAMGLCQDVDLPVVFPWMAAALGAAYTLGGRAADAIPMLRQATAQSTATENVHVETLCSLPLGAAHLAAGSMEEAHTLAERTLALARAHQERSNQAYALRLLGDIAARREPPEHEAAEAHYQQALALAKELGMRPLQAHCHHGLGTLYGQTGWMEQASAELSAAIALYRAMDMTFWLPQAEAALAQVEGQ